jgi:hypothetical protein
MGWRMSAHGSYARGDSFEDLFWKVVDDLELTLANEQDELEVVIAEEWALIVGS